MFVYETQQRQIELRSPHVDNALAAFKQQPDAIVANRMALALTNVKAMAYTRDPFRSD